MILSHPLPPAAVRAKVTQHLPWTADRDWQPLFGGRTNSAWQITGADGGSAVLKLYRSAGANPLFPNDPQAEAQLLVHLKHHDIAPDLVAHFTAEGMDCNLYHALPGRPWTDGVKEVAQLMQRLHAIAPPTGLRQVANGAAALRSQAQAILDLAGEALDVPRAVAKARGGENSTRVLLHGDIVPGNLIRCTSGLRLIDWQCPAVGDATEDLAIFLSPAMQLLYRGHPLSPTEEAAFLAQFSSDQQRRYQALSPVYHYRMAAYCLWQVKRGRAEYQDALKVELAALNAC